MTRRKAPTSAPVKANRGHIQGESDVAPPLPIIIEPPARLGFLRPAQEPAGELENPANRILRPLKAFSCPGEAAAVRGPEMFPTGLLERLRGGFRLLFSFFLPGGRLLP